MECMHPIIVESHVSSCQCLHLALTQILHWKNHCPKPSTASDFNCSLLWLGKFLRFLTGCWNQLGADRQREGDHRGDSLPMLTEHETVISAAHMCTVELWVVSHLQRQGVLTLLSLNRKYFWVGGHSDRRWFPINGTSYGCIPMCS